MAPAGGSIPENYISLDLEMNQPSGKIIQIGAVVGSLLTGEIHEELSCFIRIDEPLTDYIIQLTGITEQDLADKGMTLQEGYEKLVALHNKYNCMRNPLTWGGGDSAELREQLGLTDGNYIFGRRWLDMKTIYQMWRLSQREKLQSGLAKSLTRLGINFQGRKHNATDDARNTFKMACALLKKFRA